jgi:hypothetical protein
MARGDSGRIVIELDPQLKEQLYSALSRSGTTMKSWFVGEAMAYLASRPAAVVLVAENRPPAYEAASNSRDGQ